MSDYVLRPYQLHAIETLSAELRAGCGSILFVAPTGSGKTIVTAHAAARAAATGASIVIIVHRDELIRQTSRTLTEMSVQHGIIAAGYPENEALVQIASVMSLVQRLDRWGDVFKLAICDEAHHAVATTYRRVLTTIPYRIGLTATPERTDGQGLRELFNKMVVGPSVKELVTEGYLVPPVIYGPAVAPDLSQVNTRGGDYGSEGL
jgi:superfamily II DNA or RNA helicase